MVGTHSLTCIPAGAAAAPMPPSGEVAEIDSHPFPAAELGADGALMRTNERARDMLAARSELFRVESGRLVIQDTDAQRQLVQRLASEAAATGFTLRIADATRTVAYWMLVRPRGVPPGATGGAAASVPPRPPDPATTPSPLPVAPVAASAAAADSASRRFLVSFRAADDTVPIIDPENLVRELDLTPTEAKLAAWLAEGLSLTDCARRAGIARNTAKWHVDNARAKLGCATQKDLVRTVLLVSL